MIKRFKNRFLDPSLTITSNYLLPKGLEEQIDSFAFPFVPVDPNVFSDIADYDKICHVFDSPFVKKEFDLAFHSSNKRSLPGPDQIDYKIRSHISESYHSTLLSILNDIFQRGDFPEDWKSSIVYDS